MVIKRQDRKDCSVSAIFLIIYSIFRNRNQMSLFPHKTFDKLITMTGTKVGVPMFVDELYSRFQYQSQIRYVFNMRVHEGALNDAIHFAQKGARCK